MAADHLDIHLQNSKVHQTLHAMGLTGSPTVNINNNNYEYYPSVFL